MQEIDSNEKIFIVGKWRLKWYHRKRCRGYERVHRGHGYGEKTESDTMILDFGISFDI